jgi:hypothetical protein
MAVLVNLTHRTTSAGDIQYTVAVYDASVMGGHLGSFWVTHPVPAGSVSAVLAAVLDILTAVNARNSLQDAEKTVQELWIKKGLHRAP